jgi:hypothetical protein
LQLVGQPVAAAMRAVLSVLRLIFRDDRVPVA